MAHPLRVGATPGPKGDAVPIRGRSGVHWNYTYGYVPTESDQSVNVYAPGSWNGARRAYRRGVLAGDE